MEQKRLFALLSAAVLFMSSLSFPDPVIQAAAAEATDWEKTYASHTSFRVISDYLLYGLRTYIHNV